MSVGAPQDKAAIDSRAYGLAVQMRDLLTNIANFQVFLNTKNDAALIALGYTQAEADLLQAAFVDLDNARLTLQGLRTQPAASNFLVNSNQLVGPN